MLASLAQHYKFDIETAFDELPEGIRKVVLYGSGKTRIAFRYLSDAGRMTLKEHSFEGIIPNLERRYRETDSLAVREELSKYRATHACPACGDAPAQRSTARDGRDAQPATAERDAAGEQQGLLRRAPSRGHRAQVADKIVSEISSRLQFLINVGLDYLTLDRSADSLSGAKRSESASPVRSARGLPG